MIESESGDILPDGQSVEVYYSGDRFEGNHEQYSRNGFGIYYYANGDKSFGTYADDEETYTCKEFSD